MGLIVLLVYATNILTNKLLICKGASSYTYMDFLHNLALHKLAMLVEKVSLGNVP